MKPRVSIAVRYLALGGFCGALAFTLLVIVLHILRPQMNPLSNAISLYAIGPYGYFMTIAFITRGLGELLLLAGLVLGTMRSSRSQAGLALLALATLCSFLVAIFPGNPQNSSIFLIHSVSAFIGFVSVGVAALVWSGRFRKDTRWHSSAPVSLILGLLILISFVGSLISAAFDFEGLGERVLEVFIVLWLCFVAARLFTLAPTKMMELSKQER